MPPIAKYTRQQLIAAALDIIRRQGFAALTARSLAQALGTSTKPIFGLFRSMEEVQEEALKAAGQLYNSRILEALHTDRYPPYKASGMSYIQFAREEPELFKLLFMRDRTGEAIAEDREAQKPILKVIMENVGIDEDRAYRFHMEMWLFVHGVAVMAATGYLNWDTEFISSAMTDIYLGLKHRYTGGN